MLPTDPLTGPEAMEIYSYIDADMDTAAAKDIAEVAKIADIAAESKELLYVSTALGLAIRKMIAAPKGGLKKLKHNDKKDEMQKQNSLE